MGEETTTASGVVADGHRGPSRGLRVLAVLDPTRPCSQALEAVIYEAGEEYATVDLVGVARSARLLNSFAASAGALMSSLEAAETADLSQRIQARVAQLPKHLRIRSQIHVGSPHRVVATLLESNDYDVVLVADGVRFPRRSKAELRRMTKNSEFLVVPADS